MVKYATLWLFTLPLSPCNLYVLFTSHFQLIYSGLSWRHRIFLLPRSQYCIQRMYVWMYAKYKFAAVVYVPVREIIENLSANHNHKKQHFCEIKNKLFF